MDTIDTSAYPNRPRFALLHLRGLRDLNQASHKTPIAANGASAAKVHHALGELLLVLVNVLTGQAASSSQLVHRSLHIRDRGRRHRQLYTETVPSDSLSLPRRSARRMSTAASALRPYTASRRSRASTALKASSAQVCDRSLRVCEDGTNLDKRGLQAAPIQLQCEKTVERMLVSDAESFKAVDGSNAGPCAVDDRRCEDQDDCPACQPSGQGLRAHLQQRGISDALACSAVHHLEVGHRAQPAEARLNKGLGCLEAGALAQYSRVKRGHERRPAHVGCLDTGKEEETNWQVSNPKGHGNHQGEEAQKDKGGWRVRRSRGATAG
eukprot:943965-Prymnesium_polylepis.1